MNSDTTPNASQNDRKLAYIAHIGPILFVILGASIASQLLSLRLAGTGGMLFLIMLPLAMIQVMLWIFCPILAAKAENQGQRYRYPISFRILS